MTINTIELIGYYGGDLTHAMSAWTSTCREIDEERQKRIGALLTMLASNGHETPFEKSILHFVATTDIATHIQILKHRIGTSTNAESARYKELKEDKHYIPVDWDEEERANYIEFMELAHKNYHDTYDRLIKKGMTKKRAKESARFYQPYGTQLIADISFNFRSFVHFQRLRRTEDAQLEIRNLANEMLKQVEQLKDFELSLKAFGLSSVAKSNTLSDI